MHLFAFQPPVFEAELQTWIFIIAIVVLALLFFGFIFWLGTRQAAKSRDLKHLERMKALELGKAIDFSEAEKSHNNPNLHDNPIDNIFWISFWVGAAVPIAAAAGASTVMIQTKLQDFGIILAMWVCVAVIAVAGVVCATALMISSRHWSSKKGKDSSENDK